MRNIGISAHIDSGKTTLTERILFYTGRIDKIHEVRGKDGVGAKMDSMELEREKGITIQSAATHCQWGDTQINVIDTPGHVDFTIEVERALRVLDGAILVLCSVAGVQSQSITVDRQMRRCAARRNSAHFGAIPLTPPPAARRYSVPRLAFVNKLDREGADPDGVVAQLRGKLRLNAAAIQLPIGLSADHTGVVDLVENVAITFDGDSGEKMSKGAIPPELAEAAAAKRQALLEALADVDDEIADLFLSDEQPSADVLKAAIRRQTIANAFTPVLMGSAFKNKGVHPLLDAVVAYLPAPSEVENTALDLKDSEAPVALSASASEPLVGLAFKLEEGRFGQLTYLRVYQGTLRRGDSIVSMADGKRVRVPRIARMHSNEMQDVEEGAAGDIVAMFGVECASGTTFTDGSVSYSMTSMFVPDPVVSLALVPESRNNPNFTKALQRFSREDPTFRVHNDDESGQTIISGMGELHLEVYVERMRREYDCACTTGQPKVAFRETASRRSEFGYTHKKQSGGSGQFGRVEGYIEPIEDDNLGAGGFEFESHLVGSNIPPDFVPAIKKGFEEAIEKGPLAGYPVLGMRVVLKDGAAHAVDSNEIAFRLAAQGAFKQAMEKGAPQLLEPIMSVEVQVPVEFQGAAIGQIAQRKGTINASEGDDGDAQFVTIGADVPLDNMFGYSADLRGATQGKGEYAMEYLKHSPVLRDKQDEIIKRHAEALAAKRKAGD